MQAADLHHTRQHAVLRQLQQRLDDLAPPDDDDDVITPDEALESARHDIAATSYCAAHWLFETCGDATFPLDTEQAREVLVAGERELTTPELLALLMCGRDADLPRVRHALRQRFDAAHERDAKADAALILAEQDAELLRMTELCSPILAARGIEC